MQALVVLRRGIALASLMVVSGCAMVSGPVNGFIYSGTRSPVSATSNEGATKTGEGTCSSVLGLVAFGDCSIEAAAQEAGIKKIRSVDHKSTSVLGIFASYKVIVTGE